MKRNSDSTWGRQSAGKDGLLVIQALIRGGTARQLAARLGWQSKKVKRWIGAVEDLGFPVIVTTDEDSPRALRFKLQRSSVIDFFS